MIEHDQRRADGLEIARFLKIRKEEDGLYEVASQSSKKKYWVNTYARTCTCRDFELRRMKCKHQWAVELQDTDEAIVGPTEEPPKEKKTYPQNWPNYNAAQCRETEVVPDLLHQVCACVEEPVHEGRGRKPIRRRDIIFAMVMKVYQTMSCRRTARGLKTYVANGQMVRAPSYGTIFSYFEKPELTKTLQELVKLSALPLNCIDTNFAIDSTGLGISAHRRWYDEKYGGIRTEKGWVKLHAVVGVESNAISVVRVTDKDTADSPQLPGLLEDLNRGYLINDFSGDKAYLSNANLLMIEAKHAMPFIPFKINSSNGGNDAWQRMWYFFWAKREEFLRRYHQRSNVESTFSAMKRLFAGFLRSRTFVAQRNEVLCKVIAYNLTVLNRAMLEFGVEPDFLAEKANTRLN